MKKHVLNFVVCLSMLVSYIGIYPTSWGSLYQPEVPEELIR